MKAACSEAMINIPGRFFRSLKRKGFRETILKLRMLLADRLFDLKYGLDTCSWSQLEELTVKSGDKDHGNRYEPSRVLPLRKLFTTFKPLIPKDGVLVDFGCGKGRVLFVATEFGFRKVRGVEFAHELCKIANINKVRYLSKAGAGATCDIIEGDAAQYRIRRDENVFFLFNPFDSKILRRVTDNIKSSIKAYPRPVIIIYHNPRFDGVIENEKSFTRIREFSYCGCKFSLFSNSNTPA